MINFSEIQQKISVLNELLENEIFSSKDIDQIKRSLAYINYKISVSDPYITHPKQITEMLATLTGAENNLRNFLSTQQENEFNSATTALLNAVNNANFFAEIQTQPGREYFLQAQTVSDEKIQSLQLKIKELKDGIDAIQKTNAELIAEFKQSFTDLISGKEGQIGLAQQVTDALTQLEKKFDHELYGDGQDKQGWVAEANEMQSQLQTILENGKNIGRIIGVDGATKNDRQNLEKDKLKKIKDACNWALGLIGLGASVGGYQRRANKEAISGFLWTTSIVLTFIGTIYINYDIFTLFELHAKDKTLAEFVGFKAVTSLPFIAFITFAIFKAKNHRRMELKYRQFELELAAFEPNLSSLDENLRSAAKLLFIQKTFGQIDGHTDLTEPSIEGFMKSIGKLTEDVGKLAETAKKIKPLN